MRYAIAIEYNGSAFCGWQRQKHSGSVQEVVEAALSKVADHPVTLVCAGRTDTGVHALAQIAHFDTLATRPDRAWTFGVNTHLPASVSVHWVKRMPDDFHARFAATERSYRYSILNRNTRPGYLREYLAWVSGELDAESMHLAAQTLVGTHDFSAFRSADCQAPHANRTMHCVQVEQAGELVHIHVRGNAFLHNMIRIMAGSLIRVGLDEKPSYWIKELLDGKDRTRAGMTAPPQGLCFMQAHYPEAWGVPDFQPRLGG
ncbi:MAG: tRNA pseudouridine(38-40) synthase TruA [Gammaproteobacteria bacterium]|nr:tRNA pseudouridine(38-40) synthase TruA [Gammaproteobacteria bacterium]